MGGSRLVNRNITAAAGRTSMRLEPEVWDALREICLRESLDLREVIRAVEDGAETGGRTSAVRVHVLQYFRSAATHDGHSRAGHGHLTSIGPMLGLDDFELVHAGVGGMAGNPAMLGIEVEEQAMAEA